MATISVLVGARGTGKTRWVNRNGKKEIPGPFDDGAGRAVCALVESGVALNKIAFTSTDPADINAGSSTVATKVVDVLVKALGEKGKNVCVEVLSYDWYREGGLSGR